MHMNEGHSAFLGLERIRLLMSEKKLSFSEAWRGGLGHERLHDPHTRARRATSALPRRSWRSTSAPWPRELGLSWKDFLGLGREDPDNDGEEFCLTVLALRLSAYNNGVSRLHGRGLPRRCGSNIWPSLPLDEVPITHITNGVHPRSWITHDMVDLLDRYFGPEFHDAPTNRDIWDRIDRISDEELWRTHERRRERMVAFARRQAAGAARRGAGSPTRSFPAAPTPSLRTR